MIVIGLVDILGPSIGKLVITLYVLNKSIGITTLAFWMFRAALGITTLRLAMFGYAAIATTIKGTVLATAMEGIWIRVNWLFAASWYGIAAAITSAVAGFLIFYRVGEYLTTNISDLHLLLRFWHL